MIKIFCTTLRTPFYQVHLSTREGLCLPANILTQGIKNGQEPRFLTVWLLS